MYLLSVKAAGQRSAQRVSSGSRGSVATCVRGPLVTVVLLACLGLLGRALLGGSPGDQVSTPAIVATTRLGHRRDERPLNDPETDPSVPAASYSRFSSDMQRDESILDQQRKCRERAQANGHKILPELEFSDGAVSGTKRQREGLNAMLAAAKAGRIKVLYLYSLSRLSRESVITLPLLKDLVYNHGVRVISVSEGIDSNDTSWELIAHIMSIVHQQFLKDLAGNVLRGQEGAVLSGFSVGDYCFGYRSEPIPGSDQGRRGRNAKPRKMYVIDQDTAAWVQRIFHWFVKERRSLRWITRELNRLGAPKDHRSTKPEWRHQYLPRLLQNRKYVGWWPWGEKRNVRDPLTGKIRQEERASEDSEQWLRHLPHLRLVDDKTFEEAQRLLKINQEAINGSRKEKGKLKGSKHGASGCHPRHLLTQLIVCGHCGHVFHVGGSGGKYLCCPGHAMGTCSCRTQLRRDRAERLILDAIGQRILEDPAWKQRVLEETRKAWKALEEAVPSELASARRSLAEVEQKIARLVDRVENGQCVPEFDKRLTQRRAERRTLTERIEKLERADHGRPPEPTESWVEEQLRHLGEVLSLKAPAAAHALRDLVGGKIVVIEIREPGRERFFLQGRFSIGSRTIVEGLIGATERCGGQSASDSDDSCEEFLIAFREPPQLEVLSERAKELYDQGLMNAQIAKALGRARSYVTKLLKHWFESRGRTMPDGRSRRAKLKQKHVEPPLYERIADDAMALYKRKRLLQDIADALHVDRNTVTAAIRWWHEARDLPVPDGRTRRKDLEAKTSCKAKSVRDRQAQPSA